MKFEVKGKMFDAFSTTWVVEEVNRVSESHISSKGGGDVRLYEIAGSVSGHIKQPTIHSTVENYKMVWLKNEEGREIELRFDEFFPLRMGHKIRFDFVKYLEKDQIEHIRTINLNTGDSIEPGNVNNFIKICSYGWRPDETKIKLWTKKRLIVTAFFIPVTFFLLHAMDNISTLEEFLYSLGIPVLLSLLSGEIRRVIIKGNKNTDAREKFFKDCTDEFEFNLRQAFGTSEHTGS